MGLNLNRVLIVGGGLSGLTTATHLVNQGIDVTVLDKGYGIGGRLASRALKAGEKSLGFFDYGMQYFRAEDETFQRFITPLLKDGVISIWQGQFQEQAQVLDPGFIYYRGRQSNRAIAQHLAQKLNVINQTRVETLEWQDSEWSIKATNGACFQADAVIMTPPVPQTLDILADSELVLEPDLRSRLEQVTYDRCLSLMLVCDRPSLIPLPGGIQLKNSLLDWIASNHIKGISPEGYAITLLAGADFSERYWESDTEWIIDKMIEAGQPWLAEGSQAIATRLHRWKYRHPKTVFGQRTLIIEQPGPLVLAGDAFCDRLVDDQSLNLEQAFLSGLDAAQCLTKPLS